jgi:uncharacterized repeat protein (TIGR04138 family)
MPEPEKQSPAGLKPDAKDYDAALRGLVARDPRYPLEAYFFLDEALKFTQTWLRKNPASDVESERHITGQELLQGIQRYAESQFGQLAPTVFRAWGIRRGEDFGEMVFNLVDAGLMSKTEKDTRADFIGGFDIDKAFRQRIELQ